MTKTQLPSWSKGTLAILGAGALLFIGYKVYKKIQSIEEEKKSRKELGAVDKDLKDLPPPSLSKSQLQGYSNQLFTAMNGVGTDVTTIYKVFANVKSDSDVLNLIKIYGIQELSSGTWNPVSNYKGGLSGSLTEELNGDEIKALNMMLAKKGIKYRF